MGLGYLFDQCVGNGFVEWELDGPFTGLVVKQFFFEFNNHGWGGVKAEVVLEGGVEDFFAVLAETGGTVVHNFFGVGSGTFDGLSDFLENGLGVFGESFDVGVNCHSYILYHTSLAQLFTTRGIDY